MKRALSTIITLGLAAGGIGLAGPAASAAPAAKDPNRTEFAFNGSGFGTRVNGGDLPARSRTTAFEAIGCTNKAGKEANNHVAEATIPGFGDAFGVTTDVWTTRDGGIVASHARNSIARLVVGEPSTGTLEINAVSTVVHAIHGKSGFRAKARSRIGSLVYTDPAGQEQEVEVPAPGEPVTIPGIGELLVGHKVKRVGDHRAFVMADALRLRRAVSGTKLKIAHADAEVGDDVKHGLFGGLADAVRSTALDDNLSVGRQPLTIMPCRGTRGQLRHKSLGQVDIGEDIQVHGLSSELSADQTRRKAAGYTRGEVASVDLGDGQVVAEAIVGQVNVTRTADGQLKRNIKGSTLGTLTIDGEPQEFPDSDVIEVPGVVRIERNVVDKFKNGISVTALRFTLLDGSGAVIHLGEAEMKIRPAGLRPGPR